MPNDSLKPDGRYLDQFSIILLDMNNTFMFGEDRFYAGEDFFSTYQQLGGKRLGRAAVDAAMRNCYAGMSRDYEDPAHADDFPSLTQGLEKYSAVELVDIPQLEAVFARHEIGHIPPAYGDCLRRLSRSHQLGVVSNIWARKAAWLAEFERAGVHDIWRTQVFSSDSRSIKPSPRLFHAALTDCKATPSDVVFVGDNLRVDIAPARSLGLATVWITASAEQHPLADRVVPTLLALEALPAN